MHCVRPELKRMKSDPDVWESVVKEGSIVVRIRYFTIGLWPRTTYTRETPVVGWIGERSNIGGGREVCWCGKGNGLSLRRLWNMDGK